MEVEGEARQSSQDEKSTKRKMKTPTQLETLEKVFAEEKYPAEMVRAELSAQLGLSDRQLQMWFCHRRLKDRKVKEEENTIAVRKPKKEKIPSTNVYPASVLASEILKSALMVDVGNCCDQELSATANDSVPEAASHTLKQASKRTNKDVDIITAKRKSRQIAFKGIDINPRRAAELRAIAAVESQLGEALRQDGPILGVDFDPLPPGAFDMPIAASSRPAGIRESKVAEKREAKFRKYSVHENKHLHTVSGKHKALVSNVPSTISQAGTRTLQEYQFIPEQPSSRNEDSQIYEKSKYCMGSDYTFPSFSVPSAFLHGTDALLSAFNLQGRLPNIGGTILPQFDPHRGNSSHRGIEFEGIDPFPTVSYNCQLVAHSPLLPSRASHGTSEKMALLHEQEQLRMEKKQKSEEVRIAKEVEAHEKRIKREMERQETARRKKEEQMKKELEKQDREKKKEEERVLRERQREEERIQREQRREFERRERLLQKESKRMEQLRQKEEIRRQKDAAKMKSALERAKARRVARESIELIDDERLELLEAAAASQNLPSIYLLDGETLQGLDKYRGVLKKFPSPLVEMKKPITCRPWIDSNENVGNLLMVWKFITTFADVLGLWPFTVDEFMQAFHDYDPRLLGEIHVSLLKTLVKDIESVSQVSASGMIVNQYTVSFTGGGHPQLVEAACAWGFDIREWQKHLNALTWPEILRQFALAAGYGPKWKKQKVDDSHHDDNDGRDGEEAVNTLRSGVAVANAVTLMRGKGGGHSRRSRHRLTPGTVKYAAFHVLSVEGKKGLNILEVADRIQKSGLRDLTTSKTPEASIAAALSRDTRLFERVAPSTYCVRTPYRKDPEDAEAILQAAIERIFLFQSGGTDQEEAEKENEDVDEAEREEDSEEDAEDILADDVDDAVNEGKAIFSLREGKAVQTEKEKSEKIQNDANNSQATYINNAYENKQSAATDLGFTMEQLEAEQEGSVDSEDHLNQTSGSEKVEIDESNVGEPWVQGLMEGEYSDLSVEERLNALVVLVEMVNEGNTIRVSLEERLEAANSLKRQMWAEAQLDRRRFKEEQLLRFQPLQREGVQPEGLNPGAEEGQESLGAHNNGMDVAKPKTEWPLEQSTFSTSENTSMVFEKIPAMQIMSNQEAALCSQSGFATDKSRAQLKADIGLLAEELYVYRSLPLGSDRRHNRYWQFVTCTAGQDLGYGRIYFESSEDGHWGVIDTEESLNALMTSLDVRGIREAHLHASLQKIENLLKQAILNVDSKAGDLILPTKDGSSGGGIFLPGNDHLGQNGAISIELGSNQLEKQNFIERYNDFDRWLWSECSKGSSRLIASKMGKRRSDLLLVCDVCHELYWLRERYCPYCHATFEAFPKMESKYSQHQLECEERRWKNDCNWKMQDPSKLAPSRIQLLKAEILAIEVAIPTEALNVTWTESRRKTWASILKHTSSPADLLQILTELECSIQRDWLSPSYETTEELLIAVASESKITVDSLGMCRTSILPWVPHTSAAVALRVAAFDAAMSYSSEQKLKRSSEVKANRLTQNILNGCGPPSLEKYQNLEVQENQRSAEEEEKADACVDAQQSGQGRGRGGRPRGRGRGRSIAAGRNALSTDVPQSFKRKLRFPDDTPTDGKYAEKTGRGRPRNVRGRGRVITTLKGCGRGRPRKADIQQRNKSSGVNTNIDWQAKERLPEQTREQDGDRSDEGASRSMDEWDAEEYGECDNFEQHEDDYEQDHDEDEHDDSMDEDNSEQEEQNLEDQYELEKQFKQGYLGGQATAGSEDDAEPGSSLSSSSLPSSSSSLSSSSSSSSSSLSSSSSSEGGAAEPEEDELSQSVSVEESD